MYMEMDITIEKYIVSALVNGRRIIDTFFAKSEEQAWYFFGKKHGYNMYDFTVLYQGPNNA